MDTYREIEGVRFENTETIRLVTIIGRNEFVTHSDGPCPELKMSRIGHASELLLTR
jgi:hypothetical protein